VTHPPIVPETEQRMRWAAVLCRWALLAALTAHLLFAHGCHGDEDHELFGAVSGAPAPRGESANCAGQKLAWFALSPRGVD
jgi:hypothetical protein